MMKSRKIFSICIIAFVALTMFCGASLYGVSFAGESDKADKIAVVHTNVNGGHYEKNDASHFDDETLVYKPVATGDESNINIWSVIICVASFVISVYIYLQLTKKK